MCTYQYHIELNELRIGLNTMQAIGKDVHSCCVCKCENICKQELNITSSELCCTTHLPLLEILSFTTSHYATSMQFIVICNCFDHVCNYKFGIV
jgi:hypothetical protein